jgi:hypothetical protein
MNGPAHLYVVLLVSRMHHAVVYEMPTAAAPENAIANSNRLRFSGGLRVRDWMSAAAYMPQGVDIQIPNYVLRTPILNDD